MSQSLIFITALLPVLLYIFIIWATTPNKSISIKNSAIYFVSGVLSVVITLTCSKLFPISQNITLVDPIFSMFFFSFIQVGLFEELCKFIGFRLAELRRGGDNYFYDRPFAIMFYSGISALGFAFIENLFYATHYGGQVLLMRSIHAMFLHFVCGLVMGYWIALSRIPTKLKNRSPFENWTATYPWLKTVIYYLLGIGSATFLHGLYDFNIFTKGNFTSNYLILFSGAIAAYIGSKNLEEKIKF